MFYKSKPTRFKIPKRHFLYRQTLAHEDFIDAYLSVSQNKSRKKSNRIIWWMLLLVMVSLLYFIL